MVQGEIQWHSKTSKDNCVNKTRGEEGGDEATVDSSFETRQSLLCRGLRKVWDLNTILQCRMRSLFFTMNDGGIVDDIWWTNSVPKTNVFQGLSNYGIWAFPHIDTYHRGCWSNSDHKEEEDRVRKELCFLSVPCRIPIYIKRLATRSRTQALRMKPISLLHRAKS